MRPWWRYRHFWRRSPDSVLQYWSTPRAEREGSPPPYSPALVLHLHQNPSSGLPCGASAQAPLGRPSSRGYENRAARDQHGNGLAQPTTNPRDANFEGSLATRRAAYVSRRSGNPCPPTQEASGSRWFQCAEWPPRLRFAVHRSLRRKFFEETGPPRLDCMASSIY